MYFTRLEINPRRHGGNKLLGSPHAMHAAILASYPTSTPPGRVLWRVDQVNNSTYVYIVSESKPDATHIIEQAGWPTTQTWETRKYAPVLDNIREGNTYKFKLTANPTHSVRLKPTDTETKRIAHVTVEQQTQWLLTRAQKMGFVLPENPENPTNAAVIVTDRKQRRFRRGNRTVTIVTATYEGTLIVVDANRFREVLTTGIGPAKGYGCGLLTIAPLTVSSPS